MYIGEHSIPPDSFQRDNHSHELTDLCPIAIQSFKTRHSFSDYRNYIEFYFVGLKDTHLQ